MRLTSRLALPLAALAFAGSLAGFAWASDLGRPALPAPAGEQLEPSLRMHVEHHRGEDCPVPELKRS